MAKWREDWMHPHTDRATFNAYQDAAERIHFRRSPTDQDYAVVALYEAVETMASQLKKVALCASEVPIVKVIRKGQTAPTAKPTVEPPAGLRASV